MTRRKWRLTTSAPGFGRVRPCRSRGAPRGSIVEQGGGSSEARGRSVGVSKPVGPRGSAQGGASKPRLGTGGPPFPACEEGSPSGSRRRFGAMARVVERKGSRHDHG